jgi:hypothetical protein
MRKRFGIVGACALVGLVGSFASVSDAAVFSQTGAACVLSDPTQVNYRMSAIEALTSNTTAYCGLLRTSAEAADFSNIAVRVKDSSTTTGFTCAIRTCNEDASNCQSSIFGTTTAAWTGTQTLTHNGVDGYTNGNASIICAMAGPSAGGTTPSQIVKMTWDGG